MCEIEREIIILSKTCRYGGCFIFFALYYRIWPVQIDGQIDNATKIRICAWCHARSRCVELAIHFFQVSFSEVLIFIDRSHALY